MVTNLLYILILCILIYDTLINKLLTYLLFNELFSLKRIYVIYKDAILSHIDCSFRT